MKDETIKQITQQAKKFFDNSKWSHAWDHVVRVWNLSLYIWEKEKADLFVLSIASVLHDIWRNYQDQKKWKICHAEKWGELAKPLLQKYDIKPHIIENIIHCVKAHRFRDNKNIPSTKEAKILFDADKLDSIWAVGIWRAFLFAGENWAVLHEKDINIHTTKAYSRQDTAYREYMLKLKKIKDRMLTNEWKKLAIKRDKFMKDFFERLNKEFDGIL